MSKVLNFLYSHAARLVAILAIFIAYQLSQLPALSQTDQTALASQFGFTRSALPEPSGYEYQSIRSVHPDLEHLDGWFSGAGASVAFNDLDGDGYPNDLCLVEIRIDQVIITPAPNTSARYETFVLNPPSIDYDGDTSDAVGCLPADMNEDGYMDILVYHWGRTPTAYLYNPGVTSSLSADSYIAQEIVPDNQLWNSSAATFADLDSDGHMDLIVTNYFQDDRSIVDRNHDNPVEMQHSLSNAFNGGVNHILLWEDATQGDAPSVQYREVAWTDDADVIHAWTLAVGTADLDGDLLPEIYFANDYGPDRLLHNRSKPGELNFVLLEGERGFTTPRSKVVGEDSFKGMGIDFGDINGDGMFDMYISNIAADFSLHESHFMYLSTGETAPMQEGIAPYVDGSEPLGVSRSSWAWESRLADFNNDGVLEALQATGFKKGEIDRWPDMQELGLGNDELTANPATWPRIEDDADFNGSYHNPLFARADDGRFYDIAPDLGIDQPHVTRGIATADVDGDGDLDFATANQWETSLFYENDCPDCGAFLGLNLLLPARGVTSPVAEVIRPGHPGPDTLGYPAVGAHATVYLPDGRQLIGMVDGGNGQAGARSSDIHFGLQDIDPATTLTVDLHWRDGEGLPREKTVQLTPGWHTLLLGQGGNDS